MTERIITDANGRKHITNEPKRDQGPDYERGFIDGMMYQTQTSVNKAVNAISNCPNCEYHKNRAAMWRAEAYAQAGHDIIERPWVGLTDEEIKAFDTWHDNREEEVGWVNPSEIVAYIEAKLKEKNND